MCPFARDRCSNSFFVVPFLYYVMEKISWFIWNRQKGCHIVRKSVKRWALHIFLMCFIALVHLEGLLAQGKLQDSRVMLQGFYWESYRFGHQAEFPEIVQGQANEGRNWYQVVKDSAGTIRKGRFDLIWLPPPAKASLGAGYDPREYFNLNNAYGDTLSHRKMLEALWANGVEPLADIVVNHRNGATTWTDFKNPDWSTKTICSDDECFNSVNSGVYGLADSLRGNLEERVQNYDASRERAYAYGDFRDIDHTHPMVQKDIVRYLLYLKSMGYKGWRYDMVHGYHAKHIGYYNKMTKPTFSVGEYDWDKQEGQRGWTWNTATETAGVGTAHLATSSSVFDFKTKDALNGAIGYNCAGHANYDNLYAYDNGLGLMGDNTDGIAWKNRAVTFLENHDTGWRTDNDGKPQSDHQHDSFSNDWQVEQAYAYILTHPGVPCVYWKHYFDWGKDLQAKIGALVNARKVAGVHAASALNTQKNARTAGVYAAMVEGSQGQLYVRIGGDDTKWNPSMSAYSNYREYAAGNGWKVWVKLNDAAKNTKVQAYRLNANLGILPKIKK